MGHYNAIVLINPQITPILREAHAPRCNSLDLCSSPLWRQHYAVPGADTALLALDAVDNILSPYWDGWDVPLPPGSLRCIGYDFYRVGGVWHGQFLPGYEPERDPRNQEPCPRCWKATGPDEDTIHDEDTVHHQAAPARTFVCDRCEGEGYCLKQPKAWVQLEGANIAPATSLPQGLSPHAIVTPDGIWHESERHLFQPLSKPEASEWAARVRQILEDNRDAIAVNLDCHV